MHLSRDCLAAPEDLALLRAVLRSGARSAETGDCTKPTVQERFGRTSAVSGLQSERVGRVCSIPRDERSSPCLSAAEPTAEG
jgi:hypothetical protein